MQVEVIDNFDSGLLEILSNFILEVTSAQSDTAAPLAYKNAEERLLEWKELQNVLR